MIPCKLKHQENQNTINLKIIKSCRAKTAEREREVETERQNEISLQIYCYFALFIQKPEREIISDKSAAVSL